MSNPYGTDKALLVGTTPYFNARAVTLVACIFNIAVKPVKYNKKNEYIIQKSKINENIYIKIEFCVPAAFSCAIRGEPILDWSTKLLRDKINLGGLTNAFSHTSASTNFSFWVIYVLVAVDSKGAEGLRSNPGETDI